ncbi:MAG: hypothetical protein RLZZ479_977 [Bacteroidota bacterium]
MDNPPFSTDVEIITHPIHILFFFFLFHFPEGKCSLKGKTPSLEGEDALGEAQHLFDISHRLAWFDISFEVDINVHQLSCRTQHERLSAIAGGNL